ncbi:MAG: phosphotransferase [Candidatus Dormibacteraceae bacterium]
MLDFVQEIFPELKPVEVELRPSAVSLNSINGFLRLEDGRRLFFKTHVEPDSVINEYYNSTLLAEVGYPIYQPLYASTEYGKQFLVYELVESPLLFDVVNMIESHRDSAASAEIDSLTAEQHAVDEKLWGIYDSTLTWQSAVKAAKAPVHQLFSHRLDKRYQDFYVGQSYALPGLTLDWDDLLQRRWQVNGVEYQQTLAEAIGEARTVLRDATEGWSVVGHGDAHNGNLFRTNEGLIYFDPAFAGRHHPLLDLAKPLFHNVFATWMYHPDRVAQSLQIDCSDDGRTLRVEHNYQPSAIREMFWQSKVESVLTPLVRRLEDPNWQRMLKLALMCCPLLTMNLADRSRFSPEVGLLGLCYVVETGMTSTSIRQSRIDRALNAI